MLLQVIKTDYPIGSNGQYNITNAESCKYSFVALIENYHSLIWTDRYNECGEFELKIAATTENIIILKEDYYILASSISEHAMIIEKIDLISDYVDGDYLLVSGRSVESILDRRIIYNKLSFNGANIALSTDKANDASMVRNVINSIVSDNFVNVASNRRIYEFVDSILPSINDIATADNSPFISMNVTAELQNESCYDTIVSLCKDFGIGFKINLNQEVINNTTVIRFVLTLYYGLNLTTDLSQNQSGKVVVFSEVFNNLESSEYALETRDYKNFVKIDGIYHQTVNEQETEVPVSTYVVGQFYNKNNVLNTATNIFRRETYLDATNISDKTNATATITHFDTGSLTIVAIYDFDLMLSGISYSTAAHFTYRQLSNVWYYTERNITLTTAELLSSLGISVSVSPGGTIGDLSTITVTVYYNSGSEHKVDSTMFYKRLQNEGKATLIEKDIYEDFTAEVLPNITYKYGEDYSLGDIVTFTTKYGIIYNCRITEVTFSEDENGLQILPSFSVESSNLNQLSEN